MKGKSFAIFGLGRFGTSIANTLSNMGCEVLAVDKIEDRLNNISPKITYAVLGDATDEQFLKKIGIKNFDTAIVAIGEDIQSSILVTVLLKETGVKYVLAKAKSELHSRVLYKVGADMVILPEKEMGIRVAHSLLSKNLFELIELSPENSIVEIVCPKNWEGKSIKDLNIRVKYGVSIIAVKRHDKVIVSPKANHIFEGDELLVIIGLNSDIRKLGYLK
jgi:trk system potassium uptake protein TrkA